MKTWRWLVILVVGFALLLALFYGVEDFRGARAWSKFKRAQAADGEKLNLADFVPLPVADDQNFAMTPLLRTTFDYFHTTNGTRWRDTNAWQHLSDIRIDWGRAASPCPALPISSRVRPWTSKPSLIFIAAMPITRKAPTREMTPKSFSRRSTNSSRT